MEAPKWTGIELGGPQLNRAAYSKLPTRLAVALCIAHHPTAVARRVFRFRDPISVADSEFLALQTAVAGRFSLEREIGRGGMGIVYLARDVQLERHVAIKLLAPSHGAHLDMRRRFLREARIAAQCFHPNIVPIHAVEESDTLAWIVMPYVRGETLAERVRRVGPLAAEDVRRLAQEVGWALAYAHQRGVVHRDIKPENILIEAASGRYLIADFGIARATDSESGVTSGAGAGTPRYMAPEQALGDTVDGRADLYALGATLFVAATGRPPFEASNSIALVAQHATMLAPAVRSFAPALPVSIADAIDRCLAKRPDDRHANAEQFVEALTPTANDDATPLALVPLQHDAQSARTQLGWAAVVGTTTLLLALGETPGSFGRSIVGGIGTMFGSFIALASAVRYGEAVMNARRALRQGHNRDDVISALAGDEAQPALSPASRRNHAIAALIGAALALAQGNISAVETLPDLLKQTLEAIMLFSPAFIIARGASGALSGSRLSRWVHKRVATPAATLMAKLAARGIPEATIVEQLSLNAPTEVLLDHAVQRAIALLPVAVRSTIGNAGELASSLARTAEALRSEDVQLADQERAARHIADAEERVSALARIGIARDAIRGRLATTIAALEAVRLDILRLDVASPSSTGLTTQLEQVRQLGRRVDANAEVNALLENQTLSRSNP